MEVISYTLILTLQMLLLAYDIVMNAFIDLINPINVLQLVLFIVQDICLVFQLIVLSLELFNTSSFQAGFVGAMLRKFRAVILVTIIYFGLCVGLHVWTLTLRWADVTVFVWNNGGYYFLYVLQRGWSPLYYYYYKRAALRLGDARFYGRPDVFRDSSNS